MDVRASELLSATVAAPVHGLEEQARLGLVDLPPADLCLTRRVQVLHTRSSRRVWSEVTQAALALRSWRKESAAPVVDRCCWSGKYARTVLYTLTVHAQAQARAGIVITCLRWTALLVTCLRESGLERWTGEEQGRGCMRPMKRAVVDNAD